MALKIALLFCLLSPVIKAKEILTYDIKSNDNNLLLKSVIIDTSHLGHFVLNPSRAIPSTNTSEVKCHLSNQVSKIEFESKTFLVVYVLFAGNIYSAEKIVGNFNI